MLKPCPAQKLNAYPISPNIRDPRANGSDLLQPIGERIHPEHTFEIHQGLELFGMGESRSPSKYENRRPYDNPQGSLF
jgi:hypothetical protein